MTKQEVNEVKVLFNHIYEYKKGIRPMILYTMKSSWLSFASERLSREQIDFYVQHVSPDRVNLFFGEKACIETIQQILAERPLWKLSPQEDFILGILLGYNTVAQCHRYLGRCQSRTITPNCKSL